jgi:hypothetical protein
MDNERADQVAANYSKTTNPAYLRGREDFAQFFGGLVAGRSRPGVDSGVAARW